jgi:hypothetical protein
MNALIQYIGISLLTLFFCVSQTIADETKISKQHPFEEKYLFVWAGDQARVKPDFLAVINFDEKSDEYGKVITTVSLPSSLPGSGNVNNEPHHCHLSKDKKILACGGLLSLLHNQNSIFFFDVSNPEAPFLISSTKAIFSDITDDFLPLNSGGFLITNMGSESGSTPGKVVEYDARQGLVNEWPILTPNDGSTLKGFNPHGISARPEVNLMVTSDFIDPASTLNGFPGNPLVRSSVRVWDFKKRQISKTIPVISPSSKNGDIGTMDIKLIPNDPHKRAFTAGMFDGWLYLINTEEGSATPVFDFEKITPHVEKMPVRGGMIQILDLTKSGKPRLLTGAFMTGQIIMLDVANPKKPKQAAVVSLGIEAGPHNLALTSNDKRLVVTDYFLNEDNFGKIHFEGDHKVHVLKVGENSLQRDNRFNLDFNTEFSTGPARPHGIAMK